MTHNEQMTRKPAIVWTVDCQGEVHPGQGENLPLKNENCMTNPPTQWMGCLGDHVTAWLMG